MKTKKQNQIIVLIVLGIFIVSFLLTVTIDTGPEFTIYKESCEEKKCIVGKFNINSSKLNSTKFAPIGLELSGYSHDCEDNYIDSTCGLIDMCSKIKFDYENGWVYTNKTICEKERYFEMKVDFYCDEYIKLHGVCPITFKDSSELTKKWLNKMCECEVSVREERSYVEKCTKWKCGDYHVEVENDN